MIIIPVSGKAEHGKDSFARFLCNEITSSGKTCLIFHYADLLKFICKQYMGWNGEKDQAGRTLLQFVGTDEVRAINNNFWVDYAIEFAKVFQHRWDYMIIPDTRYPNEIDSWKKVPGFDVRPVRVVRPDYVSSLTYEQLHHISETALDTYPFRLRVVAADLDELRQAAHWFASEVL